jgi:hypothetical protein
VFYIFTYTNIDLPYTFTITWNVNKFHYNIYIYIKCKSYTIHTQTLVKTWEGSKPRKCLKPQTYSNKCGKIQGSKSQHSQVIPILNVQVLQVYQSFMTNVLVLNLVKIRLSLYLKKVLKIKYQKLVFFIWRFEIQVMGKIMVRNQIAHLIPNH